MVTGNWENSNLEKQALWDAVPARRVWLANMTPSYDPKADGRYASADAGSAAEINILGSYVQCPGAGVLRFQCWRARGSNRCACMVTSVAVNLPPTRESDGARVCPCAGSASSVDDAAAAEAYMARDCRTH